MITPPQPQHELRFLSLFDPNRGYGFPCDGTGAVDLRALSAPACSNYLRAKASIGREFAPPFITSRDIDAAPLRG